MGSRCPLNLLRGVRDSRKAAWPNYAQLSTELLVVGNRAVVSTCILEGIRHMQPVKERPSGPGAPGHGRACCGVAVTAFSEALRAGTANVAALFHLPRNDTMFESLASPYSGACARIASAI